MRGASRVPTPVRGSAAALLAALLLAWGAPLGREAPPASLPDPGAARAFPPRPASAPPPRVAAVAAAPEAPERTRVAAGPPAQAGQGPLLWHVAPGPKVEVRVGARSFFGAPAHLAAGVAAGALDVRAGDRLAIPLPGAPAADFEVERVAAPAEGVAVVQGHLAERETPWPVTLTLAPGLVLASVRTPAGGWIAEFSEGRGWVARDELDALLVDPGLSDVRDPVAEGLAGGGAR